MKRSVFPSLFLCLAVGGVAWAQQTAGGAQTATAPATKTAQTATTKASAIKPVTPTHVIVYSPNPVGAGNAALDTSNVWADQKQYYADLAKQGKLLYAGSWRDANGAMIVIRAESDQDAHEIADNDPSVKGMLFVGQVRAWNVNLVGPGIIQTDK